MPQEEIENLNLWALRDPATVRQQAQDWLNARTSSVREVMAQEMGVRWTLPHLLHYWNPVRDVILGFVHNSLEGHLEHYLRVVLGIGRKNEALSAMLDFLAEEQEVESMTEADTSEAEEELQDLPDEADNPHYSIPPSPLTGDVEMLNDESSAMPTPSSNPLPDLLDAYELQIPYETVFELTPDQLDHVHACIRDVLLPTWVERPLANLGEARHGSLKAHELLTLFVDIFPLILPELWWNSSEQEMGLLHNFCYLIASTNITVSYSISATDPDLYMEYYLKFRTTLQGLFPAILSVPNHHYAMHNPDLLQF
jgi:hypothetical protein